MANRATRRRNRSKGVVVGGLTLAAMLAATRPLLPTAVYATGLTYDWVRQNENIDPNDGYYGPVASSADGSVLLSTIQYSNDDEAGHPLYISRDNGASWQNIAADIDENASHTWTAVDVSNDGEVMLAVSIIARDLALDDYIAGGIFLSEDGGDSWTNITPEGGEEEPISQWEHAVLSGNGEKIVAVTNDDLDNVYIFEDSGLSWQAVPVDENWSMNDWDTLAISDDGSKILFGGESWDYGTTQLYFTENDGVSWENITPEIDAWEYEIRTAIDSDGEKIITALYGHDGGDQVHKVFITENDGTDWTDITPESDNPNWTAVALSDDGAVASVGNANEGKVYFTNTEEVEWSSVHPGTDYDDMTINWFSIDLNASGSRFIGSGGEEVYTAMLSTPEEDETPVVNLNNAENGKSVVLTLPSGTTVTCHSAVKEVNLSVQDAGYQYPVGLVDFCFSTEDESNEIAIVFVTDLKPNQVVARKFNPTTEQYATVSDVSITETTHGGQHALLLTYTIVDNGPLDLDPDDGEIADPIGLASTLGAPNTGLQSVRDWLFGRLRGE